MEEYRLMKRNYPFVLASVLLVCSGFLTVSAALPTSQVEYQTIADEIRLDGVVEAVKQSTASAQTTGQVIEINYDVHDFVERDAVILRLTDKKQRAARDEAAASLKEAETRLQEAQRELVRIQGIFARKLTSQAQMDAASAAFSAAKARVEASRANLVQAQEQLDFTTIEAPWSGILLERHIEVGEAVSVGQPLMTGLSLEELRVDVSVPQRFFSAFRQSDAVTVDLDSGEKIQPESKVFFPQAIARSASFRVRLNLPAGIDDLFPGMFVKVTFAGESKPRLVVDSAAILQRSELTAVYVQTDSGPRLRQVKVGREYGNKTEVIAGLQSGETVILNPVAAGILLKNPPASEREVHE